MYRKEEISPYIKEVINHYDNYFLPQFHLHITNQINFLKEFDDLLESYRARYKNSNNPSGEFLNSYKLSYHKKCYGLISEKYNRRFKLNFDQDYPEFAREFDSYLKNVSENIIRPQDDERFIIDPNDNLKIKIFKRAKRFFFSLAGLSVKFSNLFRKLFRKPAKEIKQWHHRVPLKNLVAYYMRDTVALNLISHIEDVNKILSSAFLTAWKADEEISNISSDKTAEFTYNIKSEIENLERQSDYLTETLKRTIDKTVISFEDAYRKTGTVELPYYKFSSKVAERKHSDLNKEFELLYYGWSNTFFSLFDDWRLNKELYSLVQKLTFDFSELSKKTDEKLSKNIIPHINRIKNVLADVIYSIEGFSGSSSEVKSLLYKERDRIHNKLSENIIPELSEILLAQNVPDLIDQMENNVNEGINILPEKRAIVKTTTYDERVKDSEIDFISPREIITYSTLLSFQKASSKIKNNIMLDLDEIQKSLKDIDQIADFNLESAMSMFGSDKGGSEDPLDIAIEGIKRAILKVNTVENKLNDINSRINNELIEAFNKVNNDLISLTKNENVIEIKLNIARTKTIQRTDELKQKTFHLIKNFFPIIVNGIKSGFLSVKNYYRGVRKKFGLEPPSVSISTEISDFLTATETAVSKLPFVYRRLFTIEPLEDERFFEGRDKELSILNTAYENWKLKRYAPVVVYGEKGSGITTLLNFYFNKLRTNYNVIRTSVGKNIFAEEDFIDFLKSILKNVKLTGIDDTALYLNNLVTKQIVVIENMQNLFLKKVNGFFCLKMLFELISKTNQNVFWVVSSSLYALEYLSKVINVPDHFGYRIMLEKLSDQQMIDIIIKRHRISGYNIYFEAADEKKYRKLSDEEIQGQLKKEYFSELNEFAKSNISLALLYWMRSTNEVTSDTIKLSSSFELDFSFLKAMSPEKFFMLYLLLLHDGLTVEDVVQITNKPLKEISLSLMVLLDDGIIVKRGELYMINPLLYRQIVYLLQTKNIIH